MDCWEIKQAPSSVLPSRECDPAFKSFVGITAMEYWANPWVAVALGRSLVRGLISLAATEHLTSSTYQRSGIFLRNSLVRIIGQRSHIDVD